jgi:hypothetical protein
MPFLESPDGAWIQTQLARMTQQARDSGFCSKDTPQAALFVPGSAELRDTIKKLVSSPPRPISPPPPADPPPSLPTS